MKDFVITNRPLVAAGLAEEMNVDESLVLRCEWDDEEFGYERARFIL